MPEPANEKEARFKRARPYLLLAVPFLLLAPYVLGGHGLGFDERGHMSAARQFFGAVARPSTFPAVLKDYDSTSGPLLFLLLGLWGGLTGFSPVAMRLLMLAASWLTVVLFYRLLRERRAACPLAAAFLLLFSPYFFLMSFMALPHNPSMIFGLLALTYALRGAERGGRNLWLAMLFSTLASLCRQTWLFLPAAVATAWAWERGREILRPERAGRRFDPRRGLADAPALAAPFLVMGALFLYWGGFTNAARLTRFAQICANARLDANVTELRLRPEFLNFFLVFTGAYFGVSVLLRPAPWRRATLAASALLPLFFIFPVRFVFGGGILLRLSDALAGRTFALAADLFLLALWGLGALALARAFLERPAAPPVKGGPAAEAGGHAAEAGGPVAGGRGVLLWAMVFFVAANAVAGRLWERYMVEIVPFLILALLAHVERRRPVLYAWLAFQACLAVGFACYKCFVQFGNAHFF